MPQTLRLLAACLALGVIGFFASEVLFWSFPPAGSSLGNSLLTMIAYAIAGGAALSVAISTGCGGWRGAFLGGALMGFAVEGAVVSTMFDAFPLQLVWTPLAWHALISGLGIVGGTLALARATWLRQSGALAMLGLGFGIWSFYWPIERPALPPAPASFAYLVGYGTAAALALAALDRLLPGLHPPRWALWILPAIVALIFLIQTAADPRPQRLAWPILTSATIWAMRRLGTPGASLTQGPPAPVHRHAILLILPLTAAAVTTLAPAHGVEVNWPIALATGALSLALWLRLLWRAYRSAASAAPRSSAPS